ncbi:MAG: lysophospholipid acyltransferase family protein [candidate division WOR-3 bacterium]
MRLRWRIGRIVGYALAKVVFGLKVIGQKYVLPPKGQILASNHRSYLDPFLVGLASNQETYFMAKKELFEITPLFTRLIRFWNAIPLDRQERAKSAIDICCAVLRQKKAVVIFPEGTRNSKQGLLPFKAGVGFLAITNQVPIVPVAIVGLRELWGGRFSKIIDRFPPLSNRKKIYRITVKFGEPIYPYGFSDAKEDYQRLTDIVKSKIYTLLDEN